VDDATDVDDAELMPAADALARLPAEARQRVPDAVLARAGR